MKVFAITGYSGSGKTTLVEKLIAHFVAAGLRVSALKHAHKGFDLDVPGKDSTRMRAAGASQVLVSGPKRWALMQEVSQAFEPSLLEHLQRLAEVELVLVEGWKTSVLPKLEVHRSANNMVLRCSEDARILGVSSDMPKELAQQFMVKKLALFHIDDVAAIAEFVLKNAQTIAQISVLETQQQQQQQQ